MVSQCLMSYHGGLPRRLLRLRGTYVAQAACRKEFGAFHGCTPTCVLAHSPEYPVYVGRCSCIHMRACMCAYMARTYAWAPVPMQTRGKRTSPLGRQGGLRIPTQRYRACTKGGLGGEQVVASVCDAIGPQGVVPRARGCTNCRFFCRDVVMDRDSAPCASTPMSL